MDGLEIVWVELLIPRTKGILVCCTYRPPSDSGFLSRFEQTLANVDPSKELYILGDLNIDMNKPDSSLCKSYGNILNLFGLKQVITESTRVTPNASTILDHIIVNVKENVKSWGVLCIGFSDHLVTFCSRGLQGQNSHCPNIRKVRCYREYSASRLQNELKRMDWSGMLGSTDVNYCLNEFVRLFSSAMDKVAPFREKRVKKRSNPWMNPHILSGIKLRDSLLSRYRKDSSNRLLYSEFCKVRNRVQRDIKQAKRSFFVQSIERDKGDSKKLWGHLKSLGYKVAQASCRIVLELNGKQIFDSFEVATVFNRFYSSVAADLVSKLPRAPGIFHTASYNFRRFYRRFTGLSHSFTLSPVSRHFIRKQLRSLNPNKAVGLDGVSSKFLRDAGDVIVEPVSHLINLSIITNTVPHGFKQAKVVPLFKKGSRLDPGNYRPVSVLSVLSKVLERAVHTQLCEYLEKKSVLYNKQSGFRRNFSTDTCLIGLTDYLKSEVTNGNYVGMVLIDLQKAFDTVDHGILLSKLEAIGVTSIPWFKSYLSGREQCVEVDGIRSDFLPINCGVPQGSILGPQLFLLYMNDLCISVDCKLSLYADDSALIFAHKDPSHVASFLSSQLSSCKNWLTDNRLSLHIGKTESILFGTSRRLKRVRDYEVKCGGTLVKQVQDVKYLGVQLNSVLDGKSHAKHVIKKCGTRLSFLYRYSSLLDFKTRKSLCLALIQPYLDYCCSSWYNCLMKAWKSKFEVIQRKMIRFCLSLHHLDHVGLFNFAEMSWLTFADRVKYFQLCHVFKVKVGKAPSYIADSFKPVSSLHVHSTRSSVSDYAVSRSLSNAQSSFSFNAMREWNSMPSDLKTIQSESAFHSKLKLFFLDQYRGT